MQSRKTVEMQTSEWAVPGRHKRTWHLLPTGLRGRVSRARCVAWPRQQMWLSNAWGQLLAALQRRRLARRPTLEPPRATSLCPALQFRVKQTPAGAAPAADTATQATLNAAADAAALSAAAEAAAAAEAGAVGAADVGADGDKPTRLRSTTLLRRPGAGMEKAGELMRASQAASQAASTASSGSGVQRNPQRSASRAPTFKQSPIERMYRRFWDRKGGEC